MNLQQFLVSIDPDKLLTPQDALTAAIAYSITEPVFITSNTLTVYVVGAGLYDVFNDIATNVASPVRGICMALMDRLRGQSEFNLSSSLPLGQANIQMLNTLISALPEHAVKITSLRNTLMAISNKVVFPFATTTLHDVMIVRDECPVIEMEIGSDWLVMETLSACPIHNPRISAYNPRTGKLQRIANFMGVGVIGSYETLIPREYIEKTLYIDNVYGAF
jgi:hypothetical protein